MFPRWHPTDHFTLTLSAFITKLSSLCVKPSSRPSLRLIRISPFSFLLQVALNHSPLRHSRLRHSPLHHSPLRSLTSPFRLFLLSPFSFISRLRFSSFSFLLPYRSVHDCLRSYLLIGFFNLVLKEKGLIARICASVQSFSISGMIFIKFVLPFWIESCQFLIWVANCRIRVRALDNGSSTSKGEELAPVVSTTLKLEFQFRFGLWISLLVFFFFFFVGCWFSAWFVVLQLTFCAWFFGNKLICYCSYTDTRLFDFVFNQCWHMAYQMFHF